MKEPTQRIVCPDIFQRQKDGGKTQNQSREGRSFGGGLIPVQKQMSKKEDHARPLITGSKSPPTLATMNVNALAASKNCPAYAEWKLG